MIKQISKIAAIGFASTLALAVTANNAQSFDFSFSFDDDPGDDLFGYAHRSGTVTGTLKGLNDNKNDQYPTAVTIESAPASLGISTFPLTLTQIGQDGGGIDVLNGEIIDIEYRTYYATDPDLGHAVQLEFNAPSLSAGNALFCYAGCPVGSGVTGNTDGFSGITFSSTATPVPFGVSGDLSIIILSGLYGASRLRKKFAASK